MLKKCDFNHIDNKLPFIMLVSYPRLLISMSQLFLWIYSWAPLRFIPFPPLLTPFLDRSLTYKIMLNMKFSFAFSTIHIPRVLWNRTCHTESKECRFIFQNYYQIKIFVIAKPKLKLRNYIWNMYVSLFWQFSLCIRCKLYMFIWKI